MNQDPFHEGERSVQERAGVRRRLQELGPRVIRDYMPEQHRQFFGQLPFVLIGTMDEEKQPWASLLAGPPGFITTPTERLLRIAAAPLPGDRLHESRSATGGSGLAPGMPIGLLGIEPHTRRRNRMNGHVAVADADAFEIAVDQSFGNCPKYIQARRPEYVAERVSQAGRGETLVQLGGGLDEAARTLVANADTFFIATAHPLRGVDVSHRGGPPGFVRLQDDGSLLSPDYAGNHFYNTLGNLTVNPRAGLLFLDFDSGSFLQIAVSARIIWDVDLAAGLDGALRLLRFEVLQTRWAQGRLPLRWGPAEMSPYLPHRGDGATTAGRR
jgi:predicted pyridoxine 5'-phosphate oxidase superfamily flavin-nucleotide-binding protein